MIAAISAFASWLASWFTTALQFLLDLLLWVPRKTYELALDGIGAVFTAIPVPDVILQQSQALAGISGPVIWWLSVLQVPLGLAMVLAASVTRFLIRRIPFIG